MVGNQKTLKGKCLNKVKYRFSIINEGKTIIAPTQMAIKLAGFFNQFLIKRNSKKISSATPKRQVKKYFFILNPFFLLLIIVQKLKPA